METILGIAKGIVQYAPSFLSTTTDLLSSPREFLKSICLSQDPDKELKRACSVMAIIVVMVSFSRIGFSQAESVLALLSRSRLSEQKFRVDKWRLCRG